MSEDWKAKYEAEVESHKRTQQELSTARFRLLELEKVMKDHGISLYGYGRALDEIAKR